MHYSSKFITLSNNVCVAAFMILCVCVCVVMGVMLIVHKNAGVCSGDRYNSTVVEGLLVRVVLIGIN
jgi:hypothetical protein